MKWVRPLFLTLIGSRGGIACAVFFTAFVIALRQLFVAISNNILTGDDSYEFVLIVDYGDIILIHGTVNQIFHFGVHMDGLIMVSSGDAHNRDILHCV